LATTKKKTKITALLNVKWLIPCIGQKKKGSIIMLAVDFKHIFYSLLYALYICKTRIDV